MAIDHRSSGIEVLFPSGSTISVGPSRYMTVSNRSERASIRRFGMVVADCKCLNDMNEQITIVFL